MEGTGFCHVTSRGAMRQTLFHDERDYARLLKYVATAIERFGWTCHAYCVIPNHFHLLIELTEPNLGRGMLVVNGSYARYFNWRHKREGHVFERKYHSEPIDREEHFLETIRYIANNPVRHGLCERPEDWRWSSYRATAGLAEPPDWLTVGHVQRTCDAFGGYATFCNQVATKLQPDCGVLNGDARARGRGRGRSARHSPGR